MESSEDAGFGPVFDADVGVDGLGVDFGLQHGFGGGDREGRGALDRRRAEEEVGAEARLVDGGVFVVGVGGDEAVVVGVAGLQAGDRGLDFDRDAAFADLGGGPVAGGGVAGGVGVGGVGLVEGGFDVFEAAAFGPRVQFDAGGVDGAGEGGGGGGGVEGPGGGDVGDGLEGEDGDVGFVSRAFPAAGDVDGGGCGDGVDRDRGEGADEAGAEFLGRFAAGLGIDFDDGRPAGGAVALDDAPLHVWDGFEVGAGEVEFVGGGVDGDGKCPTLDWWSFFGFPPVGGDLADLLGFGIDFKTNPPTTK